MMKSTQSTRNQRSKLSRLSLALVVALASSVVGGCCDDDDKLDFEAVAGQTCQDCEACASDINSCICDTCTEYAFDADAKQLLVCTGIWKVYKECPGGVSVACAGNGYELRCLDEGGQPS